MTQIRLKPGGPWHRRKHGTERTGCDEPIAGPFASRDHELDADLCPKCFTHDERDTGELKKMEREAACEDRTMFYDEDDEPTDRHEIPL